jgi:hypothetical protein
MTEVGAGLVFAGVAVNFENVALKMALVAFLGMMMMMMMMMMMSSLVERKQ